jgi:hypothetical protein
MTFFTAYKAVDVNIPIYFIESTAPNNVDDTDKISTDPLPHLALIPDSDDAVRQIAAESSKSRGDGSWLQQPEAGSAENLYGCGDRGEQGSGDRQSERPGLPRLSLAVGEDGTALARHLGCDADIADLDPLSRCDPRDRAVPGFLFRTRQRLDVRFFCDIFGISLPTTS